MALGANSAYRNETGKPRKVLLPDGSQALLSDHSQIRLMGEWSKGGRELELDGESTFTIKGDAGKIFVIHTSHLLIEAGGGVTKAGGTTKAAEGSGEAGGARFRVDAFKNNPGEEVDLFSGLLKVRKTYHSDTDNEPETLQSGEMVMINRDIDLMEKEKLTAEELKKLGE